MSGDLDKAAATVSTLRSLYPTNAEVLYASYRIYSDLAGEAMLSLSLVAPNSARMHQVMAHELVHALQDQHFNLRRFEKWPKGDSDAELAAHALVEGEATLVMILYDLEQQGFRGIDITKLGSLTERLLDNDAEASDPNYPVLSEAPRVLQRAR